VLLAMGLAGLLASSAVRASGGWSTIESDWIRFSEVWTAARQRHAQRKAVA